MQSHLAVSVYAIVLSGVCLALYHFPNYVQNASRRVHYYLTGEQPVPVSYTHLRAHETS